MTENKRFKQLTEKGFTHAFLDTKNLNISYICDNSNDCKNIVNLLNDLNDKNKQLKQEKERNKKAERIKLTIRLIIVLIALGLILWGVFFPLTKEYVIQQILGMMCVGIALGISIGRS